MESFGWPMGPPTYSTSWASILRTMLAMSSLQVIRTG